MLARIVCSLVVTIAAAGCAHPAQGPEPLVVATDLSPADVLFAWEVIGHYRCFQ